MMPSAMNSSAVAELNVNAGAPRELLVSSKGLPPPLWVFPPLFSACAEDEDLVDEEVLLFELAEVEDLEVGGGAPTGTVVIELVCEGGDGDMDGAIGIVVSVMMLFDGATTEESCIVLWPMDWLAGVVGRAPPVVVVTTATLQRSWMPLPCWKRPMMDVSETSSFWQELWTSELIWMRPCRQLLLH